MPTFPDDILYVLATFPKQDDSLAIAYYITVSPPLTSPKVLQAYFAAVCRTGITEAFYFTRKQDRRLHRDLLEQLIVFVHSTKPGETRAKRAMDIINLPFSDEEEEWFEEYLLHGKAKHLQGAKDTVMMRRVAAGKLENLSSDLEALGGKRLDGLNWDDLKKNLRPGPSVAGA
jgi:protein ELYS